MPIVSKSGAASTPPAAAASAAPPKRIIRRPAPAAQAEAAPAEAPAEEVKKPAVPAGIKTAAQRAAEAAKAKQPAPDEAAKVAAEAADDDLSWAASGEEAEAKAAEIARRAQEEREERRARGYWPSRFGLIAPSIKYPNRYQADIIILDTKTGPAYWEHVLRNPKTGRYDLIEPCPHEYDNCPLCGPENTSKFVMLLTVLNINGYTIQSGDRAGQHVPITKELLVPLANDHAFYHKLHKEHGTLRGIQLTMTRADKYQPNIGMPTFVGIHTDEQIEEYIKSQGMWQPKITREGEKIADEDWLMHPFEYKEFLHRPSGADLRARYANGAPGPVGASGGQPDPQWGNSRYQPNPQGIPGVGGKLDELDGDIPF